MLDKTKQNETKPQWRNHSHRNLIFAMCLPVQAQRRSRDQSRSASALSISGGEEKSEHSEAADQRLSTYSDGGAFFSATSTGIRRLSQMGMVTHTCNLPFRRLSREDYKSEASLCYMETLSQTSTTTKTMK